MDAAATVTLLDSPALEKHVLNQLFEMKFQRSRIIVAILACVVAHTSAKAVPTPPKILKEVVKKGAAVIGTGRSSRSSVYSAVLPAPQYKVSPQYAQQLQEHYAQQVAQYPSLGVNSAQYSAALASAAASLRQPKKPVYHATPLQPYGSLIGEVSLHSAKPVVLDATDGSSSGQYSPSTAYSPEFTQAAYRALKAAYADRTPAANAAGIAAYPAAAVPVTSITANDAKHSDVVIPEPKYAPVVYKPSSYYPSATYTAPATHATQVAHAAHVASSHTYRDEEHSGKEDEYASKYKFGYQVRDPKHGSYFGHSEARDGHVTKGHYHVLLPDGRLQNVQYYADPSGFHAQVSYNGVARHTDTHSLEHSL